MTRNAIYHGTIFDFKTLSVWLYWKIASPFMRDLRRHGMRDTLPASNYEGY